MGIVRKQLSQSNNMKFLLVLAVAAYAKAEADPGFAYHVGPLAYAHYPVAAYHHPLVYTAAAGCRNNEGALVPCAHGVLPTLAYGLVPAVAAAPASEAEDEAVVSVEKREATAEPTADPEADPEADPWYSYYGVGYAGHPYGYGYHAYSRFLPYSYGFYSYGLGGCRNGYGALVPC